MAFIRGRDPVFVALSLGEEASRWALAFGYNGTPFFERKDMDRFGREKGEENALLLHRTDNSLHSFGEAALETFESLDDDEREEFLFFRHFTVRVLAKDARGLLVVGNSRSVFFPGDQPQQQPY